MIKVKISKEQLKSSCMYLITLHEEELNNLLNLLKPLFYTAGQYGLSANVYVIDRYNLIVRGNKPYGEIKPSEELIEKYSKFEVDNAREALILLHQFVIEAKNEAEGK